MNVFMNFYAFFASQHGVWCHYPSTKLQVRAAALYVFQPVIAC